VVIELNGSLHLPNNITEVQTKVATSTNPGSTKPWFHIQGKNVSLLGKRGESIDCCGSFHGYGQQWWDIGERVSGVPDKRSCIPYLIWCYRRTDLDLCHSM
jgi:hypothetical protein